MHPPCVVTRAITVGIPELRQHADDDLVDRGVLVGHIKAVKNVLEQRLLSGTRTLHWLLSGTRSSPGWLCSLDRLNWKQDRRLVVINQMLEGLVVIRD